jgi:hypothetical protein
VWGLIAERIFAMYIQYVGFDGTAASRVYGFHVINAAREAREFTVEIHTTAFGPSRLGFQDGPGICFTRLQKGLEEESHGNLAEGHLNISDQDVHVYLESHRSVRDAKKRKRQGLATNASFDRQRAGAPSGPGGQLQSGYGF